MGSTDIQPQTIRAQELYGDFWFNSDPVPISALRGQVILIHFWDFTSCPCLQALPYVSEWHRKYSVYGLVVVGVHTPRFPFGKNPELVERAIRRFGMRYPVVTDNEEIIAARYGSRAWPTMVLIDKDGFIRYQHGGGGNFGTTEHVLQTLLYNAGVGESLPLIMDPIRSADRPGAVLYRATPELFAGYLRGTIGNIEGPSPESVVDYADPQLYLDGRIYAAGRWMNGKDSLQLGETGGREGHVMLEYQALEVCAVLSPEQQEKAELIVRQDDHYLKEENRGDDVLLAADGKSYVVVDEPRLYKVVSNREYGEHVLRLSLNATGVAVYSFTFVSSVIPELVPNN